MAKIKIETPKGDIIVRLYDETPKHRDNILSSQRRDITTAHCSTVSSRTL